MEHGDVAFLFTQLHLLREPSVTSASGCSFGALLALHLHLPQPVKTEMSETAESPILRVGNRAERAPGVSVHANPSFADRAFVHTSAIECGSLNDDDGMFR